MSASYPRARAAGASAGSGAGAAGAPRAVGDPAGEKGAAAGRASSSSSSSSSASSSSAAAAASLRAAPAPARPAVARADLLLGALFLALALATRLWRIEDPRAIVFDESHFTKFSTWYLSGHYYVDIHPPLAKLVYAGVLRALGFAGAGELRVKWWTADGFVGTRDWMLLYEEEFRTASGLLPYLPLRWAAAFAGCALVVAMFATARALGLGRAPAAVATTLVLCETVTALQSRLILCDAWLYLFNVASFGACVREKGKEREREGTRERGREREGEGERERERVRARVAWGVWRAPRESARRLARLRARRRARSARPAL